MMSLSKLGETVPHASRVFHALFIFFGASSDAPNMRSLKGGTKALEPGARTQQRSGDVRTASVALGSFHEVQMGQSACSIRGPAPKPCPF